MVVIITADRKMNDKTKCELYLCAIIKKGETVMLMF